MGKTAQIMEWNNEYDKYSEEQRRMIKHLPMKPGEILAKYKRGSGGREDKLTILADLNGCDKKTIAMILKMEESQNRNASKKQIRVKKEKKVETAPKKTTAKTTTRREKVPALIWNVIEREYKDCNERIDSLKRELKCAETALVSFADFLDKHEAE